MSVSLFESLSGKAKDLIASSAGDSPALEDFIKHGSVVQPGEASQRSRGLVQASEAGASTGELERRRGQLIQLLDELEDRITLVLSARRREETTAYYLILGIGVSVLVVMLLCIVWSVVKNGDQTLLPLLLSSAGSAAFLAILFFPVKKLLQIANDRSLLMVLPFSFKAEVLTADSAAALDVVAKKLHKRLQSVFSVEEENLAGESRND